MSTDAAAWPRIVLTPEQVIAVHGAQGSPVELWDQAGQRIGFANLIEERDYEGWTAEDIAIAKARSAAHRPGRSIEQVLEYLRSLDRK